MAKIVEEIIQIKLSVIVKDDAEGCSQIGDAPELFPTLESVTKEFVGKAVVVEVEQIK